MVLVASNNYTHHLWLNNKISLSPPGVERVNSASILYRSNSISIKSACLSSDKISQNKTRIILNKTNNSLYNTAVPYVLVLHLFQTSACPTGCLLRNHHRSHYCACVPTIKTSFPTHHKCRFHMSYRL